VDAGLEPWDQHARDLAARPVVMSVLAEHLSPEEYGRLDAWWDAFAEDPAMSPGALVICHHDLWQENLLVDEQGALTGVLDWALVNRSDRAHDFTALRHFGEAFTEAAIAAYRAAVGDFDDAAAGRAERSWEARDLGGLAFAVEHEDEENILDQIRKVRAVHFGT